MEIKSTEMGVTSVLMHAFTTYWITAVRNRVTALRHNSYCSSSMLPSSALDIMRCFKHKFTSNVSSL